MFHIWTHSLSQPHTHMPSATFTHLWTDSNTHLPQRYPSSLFERLFRPGTGCKPSGWSVTYEGEEDAQIKGAHLLPCMWHRDMYRLIIQISRSITRGGGGSVLFIIIKIWPFLYSPLSSPHAQIPPPQSWWSQLLKSAICSIIFNYPAITASIIPLSSIVNRNHLLIGSKGQLEDGWKLILLQ